jgi:hypothetical protein
MPAILYCYSNMGRHYINEYLTPSDSEGLNLMNIMPTHIWSLEVKSHEYNAYPYLNNNKVWPAWIISILIGPCLSPFIPDPTGCVQLVISLLII